MLLFFIITMRNCAHIPIIGGSFASYCLCTTVCELCSLQVVSCSWQLIFYLTLEGISIWFLTSLVSHRSWSRICTANSSWSRDLVHMTLSQYSRADTDQVQLQDLCRDFRSFADKNLRRSNPKHPLKQCFKIFTCLRNIRLPGDHLFRVRSGTQI